MKKEERIQFLKDNAFSFTLIIIAAILITWTGIAFKQNVFRILPLYISLIIGMLQAKANRYANLIGSINCLIYSFYSLICIDRQFFSVRKLFAEQKKEAAK